MREVDAFEAKNELGQLVEHGEEIVITRHGKEVARLVPPHKAFNRDQARAAVSQARAAIRRIRERREAEARAFRMGPSGNL
jgi:prevent-host-death family protein